MSTPVGQPTSAYPTLNPPNNTTVSLNLAQNYVTKQQLATQLAPLNAVVALGDGAGIAGLATSLQTLNSSGTVSGSVTSTANALISTAVAPLATSSSVTAVSNSVNTLNGGNTVSGSVTSTANSLISAALSSPSSSISVGSLAAGVTKLSGYLLASGAIAGVYPTAPTVTLGGYDGSAVVIGSVSGSQGPLTFLGTKVTTIDGAGNTRNTIDDGGGNLTTAGLLTTRGGASVSSGVLNAYLGTGGAFTINSGAGTANTLGYTFFSGGIAFQKNSGASGTYTNLSAALAATNAFTVTLPDSGGSNVNVQYQARPLVNSSGNSIALPSTAGTIALLAPILTASVASTYSTSSSNNATCLSFTSLLSRGLTCSGNTITVPAAGSYSLTLSITGPCTSGVVEASLQWQGQSSGTVTNANFYANPTSATTCTVSGTAMISCTGSEYLQIAITSATMTSVTSGTLLVQQLL